LIGVQRGQFVAEGGALGSSDFVWFFSKTE